MKRHNVWENNQRHYCSVCNAWMGSDRQSILIHENGKKHRENAEASLKKQREEKLKQEKAMNLIASTLQKMNEAVAVVPDGFISSSTAATSFQPMSPQVINTTTNRHTSDNNNKTNNIKHNKNRIKEDDFQDPMKKEEVTSHGNEEYNIQSNMKIDTKNRKRKKMYEEGYYTVGDQTFLCGHIFYEILEVDMLVEIFTGSSTMTKEYQQSLDALPLWKTGVILAIHGNKTNVTNNNNNNNNDESDPQQQQPPRLSFDISYLNNINDEDETIETKVDPIRLRLRMGMDDSTPKTLEEAELALLGGEDIVTFQQDLSNMDIDENTGLSKWGTVSVRKVTTSHEVKEERKRQKVQKQEEHDRRLHESKEHDRRRMEETQQLHGLDSALGAYDVFNTMKGYKGVVIHDEVNQRPLLQQLLPPPLHSGSVSISFKAKSNAQNQNKKKLRKTKADDSDDDDD